MKKFAKITAIIALVLAVLGLVLTIIGALGGGHQLIRTFAKEGRLSFGPEDLEWFDGISIVVDEDSTITFNNKYEIITAGNYEFTATEEEVDSFVFELVVGDVDIKQGTGENWEVSIDGIGKYQTYVDDGTLYVVGGEGGIISEFGSVTIVIPQTEQLKRTEICLDAGDMDIYTIVSEDIEINAGAGDISIESAYAENFEVAVGAGQVQVEGGEIGNLEVSVGMGAAYITGDITGNVDGAVAMGELEVEVLNSEEGNHNYNISCAAGEVQIGRKSYAGVGNSVELDNGADTTYNLECSMGRIEVSFK